DIDLSTKYPGLHFGVHRSPIKTVKQAIKLVSRIIKSPYLKLDGLMGYEAQIAGVTDNNPNSKIKNSIIRKLKKNSSKKLMKKRKKNNSFNRTKRYQPPLHKRRRNWKSSSNSNRKRHRSYCRFRIL